MKSQVSGLGKFGSGKSMDLPNFDLESHAMSVTCIIKLIILQTTHNMFHIAHIIIHITHNVFISFIRMPWDLGIMDLTLGFPKMRAKHMGPQLGILLLQTQSLLHSFIRTPFHFIHGPM